jgi:aminoglycoside phosphotransferase (APT) family kinase protein
MAGEVLTDVAQITRFPTGLRHFVFQAVSGEGQRIVVRVSRREDVGIVNDSLYWSDTLRPLGVPLPKILYADVTLARHPFPFSILERLPGRDLCFEVGNLKQDELRGLVHRLSTVQAIVTDLPLGRGYGFSPRREGPFPHDRWRDVIASSMARSRKRIRDAGIVSENHVDRVEAASDRLLAYFASVPPTPFLHDITTKNVIIEGARLTGIVDVDDLCFGDPLLLVGLIRVALLANGHSPAYADAWVQILQLDTDQQEALDFYTALFCLDFMAELGHSFNRARAAPVDKAYVEHLEGLLNRYLAE